MEDCSTGHSAGSWVWKPNFGSFCCSQLFVQEGKVYFLVLATVCDTVLLNLPSAQGYFSKALPVFQG